MGQERGERLRELKAQQEADREMFVAEIAGAVIEELREEKLIAKELSDAGA